MKMIALSRQAGQPVDTFPDSVIIPDSAITLPGKPLFVPDFAETWEARLLIGVRVSRLGKGIAPRFASRYYDAATLLMQLVPVPAENFPGSLACAFDGCIQQGTWIEVQNMPDLQNLTVSSGDMSLTFTSAQMAIDEAVASVARYLTRRNGDIICPLTLPWRFSVTTGDIIEASLGNQPGNACLRARLK